MSRRRYISRNVMNKFGILAVIVLVAYAFFGSFAKGPHAPKPANQLYRQPPGHKGAINYPRFVTNNNGLRPVQPVQPYPLVQPVQPVQPYPIIQPVQPVPSVVQPALDENQFDSFGPSDPYGSFETDLSNPFYPRSSDRDASLHKRVEQCNLGIQNCQRRVEMFKSNNDLVNADIWLNNLHNWELERNKALSELNTLHNSGEAF